MGRHAATPSTVSPRGARRRLLTRPAGLLASSALAVTGVLGGAVAFAQPSTPAQAAPAAALPAAPQTDGTAVVHVDGKAHELSTAHETLALALQDAGIVVDRDDAVSAPLSEAVPAEVTIARVETKLAAERQVDAHGTREVPDANLPTGERRVTTEGVDGVTQVVSNVTTKNGTETAREEIARVVVSTKVDEVVAVGTKEPVAAPASPAAPSAPAAAAAPAATDGSPRAIAAQMVSARGWGADQMQCLDNLWTKESGWSVTADNPTSSAYGIPQALPGSKMASAGADWQTNPATQITWGLGYISDRYGTPCAAWGHSQANNWY